MYTNVVWHVRLYVFLCKQKTAYEMRISDWSSDVCSSDLDRLARRFQRRRPFAGLPDLAVRFAANGPGARPVIDDLRHRRGECMAAVAQVLEPGQRLRRRPGNGHRVAARLLRAFGQRAGNRLDLRRPPGTRGRARGAEIGSAPGRERVFNNVY